MATPNHFLMALQAVCVPLEGQPTAINYMSVSDINYMSVSGRGEDAGLQEREGRKEAVEEGKEMVGMGRREEKEAKKEQGRESTWLSPSGKSDWTKPPCWLAPDY